MPAKFHPLSPAIWDRAMRDLSADGKLVRLYLLTCANRLSEGLFQIPLGIIAHDTGLPVEVVELALEELEVAGLARYDADAEVVLDCTSLRYMPLRNGKDAQGNPKPDARIPGAIRMLQGVPDTPLKRELFQLANQYAPDLAAAISERFPELGGASTVSSIEAPGRPPKGGLEAARRAEPIRDERDASREAEEERMTELAMLAEAIGAGSVGSPSPRPESLCGFCEDSALLDSAGTVRRLRGIPYCGWCQGVPV